MTERLLRAMSTQRSATGCVVARYNPATETSEILENGKWLPSWQLKFPGGTKKADMETGEDQKGQ